MAADAARLPKARLVLTTELIHEELWARLAAQTHEMEVNHNYRRMTPALIIRVQGLQPKGLYKVFLLFVPMGLTIRGSDGVWNSINAPTKHPMKASTYAHPRGTMAGRDWMSDLIGFNDIFLTTYPAAVRPMVHVTLFRRYQLAIQFVGPGNPELLVLSQLQFVTVSRSSSRLQVKLKADGSGNSASYKKRIRTESGMRQRFIEEKPPLHGLHSEQLGKSLRTASFNPSEEKCPYAFDCSSCGLPVDPQSACLPPQEAASSDQFSLHTTAHKDFWGFALPTTTGSCDTKGSHSVALHTSSSIESGPPVTRSESAAQASQCLRDCSLPSNPEQPIEASERYQDFPPVPCDNTQSGLLLEDIEHREEERLYKPCADLNAGVSSQLLEARKKTEQSTCPRAEAFWTRFCAVCLDMSTDSVADIVANENTESAEFQSWIDVLASDIECNGSTSVTTVGEKLLEVLVYRFFSLRLGHFPTASLS
ncbi:unnamed protein product [Ixodes pacificus]